MGRLGNQMFQYAYLFAQEKRGQIEDIYVQDPALFEDYFPEIQRVFAQGITRKTDQVAIHVRRGDYVNNPFYVNLSATDYYEKAMTEFPEADFLVFSDDIDFCKRRFGGSKFEFAEGNDEITDFNLMASCTGHIIANSSFSWWAAYIAPYTKKVVAPKSWYADDVERTKCPNTWKRM